MSGSPPASQRFASSLLYLTRLPKCSILRLSVGSVCWQTSLSWYLTRIALAVYVLLLLNKIHVKSCSRKKKSTRRFSPYISVKQVHTHTIVRGQTMSVD
jgi:hypothetical protein